MEKNIINFLESYFNFDINFFHFIDDIILFYLSKNKLLSIINLIEEKNTQTESQIYDEMVLEKINLIKCIEKTFNITISDSDIFNTLDDLINLIKQKL